MDDPRFLSITRFHPFLRAPPSPDMPGILTTSQQSHGATRKPKVDAEWKFHFRGGFDSDSDSSEEDLDSAVALKDESLDAVKAEELTAKAVTTGESGSVGRKHESEEARLLRELDIASRAAEDAAQFTTTPWTIARVNANLRAPVTTSNRFTPEKLGKEEHEGPNSKTVTSTNSSNLAGKVGKGRGLERAVESNDGREKTNVKHSTQSILLAQNTGPSPKLGKTLEKYFAARKHGGTKCKPMAQQRIQASSGSSSSLRDTGRLPMQHIPEAPKSASYSQRVLRFSGQVSPLDRPKHSNQAGSSLRPPSVSQSLTVINSKPSFQSSSQSVSRGSKSNTAQNYSTTDLADMESQTSSTPRFLAEEMQQVTSCLPPTSINHAQIIQGCVPSGTDPQRGRLRDSLTDMNANNWNHNPLGLPSLPGNRPSFQATVYNANVAICAEIEQSNVIKTRPNSTGSRHNQSQGRFSSPLHIDYAPSGIPIKEEFDSLDDFLAFPSGAGSEDSLTLRERNFHHQRPPRQTTRTSNIRSFSSPIKPTGPVLQNPGRTNLKLESPGFSGSINGEYAVVARPPQRSITDLGQEEHELSRHQSGPYTTIDHAVDSWQDAYSRLQAKKEDVDDQLFTGKPRRSLAQSKSASSPIPVRSRPSDRATPSPPRRDPQVNSQPAKRIRDTRSSNDEVCSAYEADEDEDSTWSTLPQRKKPRTVQASAFDYNRSRTKSMKQSGRFKLPIALPLAAKVVVGHEPTSAGKKRVVTYLPPPRDVPAASHPTVSNEGTCPPGGIQELSKKMVEHEEEARTGSGKAVKVMKPASEWSLKRFSFGHDRSVHAPQKDARSSPSQSSIAPGHERVVPKAERVDSDEYMHMHSSGQGRQEDEERRKDTLITQVRRHREALTDIKSDETESTLCENSPLGIKPKIEVEEEDTYINGYNDLSVAFDSSALEESYPEVRRIMLERKAAESAVWDELGLPSCGVPFNDSWKTEGKGKYEIAIVVWKGIPEKQQFGAA